MVLSSATAEPEPDHLQNRTASLVLGSPNWPEPNHRSGSWFGQSSQKTGPNRTLAALHLRRKPVLCCAFDFGCYITESLPIVFFALFTTEMNTVRDPAPQTLMNLRTIQPAFHEYYTAELSRVFFCSRLSFGLYHSYRPSSIH